MCGVHVHVLCLLHVWHSGKCRMCSALFTLMTLF